MLVYYRFLHLNNMFFNMYVFICIVMCFGKTDMLSHWGVATAIISKQIKIREAKKT